MSFFICNDRFYKEGNPVITPDNRGLKYGDGLFETMKMIKGKLQLKEYHFERLFNGMRILGFNKPLTFTPAFLEKKIIALAKKNTHSGITRIRVMVLRGNRSVTEAGSDLPDYIIQTHALTDSTSLNGKGFIIDVYPDVKKSCDILSNLKTNNFLPYTLAARYAEKNKLNDCILLNSYDKISDTTIANIFIIKDKKIYTPSLDEGCIAGVMRRWIIEKLKTEGKDIVEKSLTIEDLKQADEVFLTNSIDPVRWVRQFQNVRYNNTQVKNIYDEIMKTF
ncbi:MAG: aminotransferase class IV [Ginsengibacter sp.]